MDTTRVSPAPTRQVITLPVSQLAMLVRFAILAELHDRPTASTCDRARFEMALVSYSSCRRVEDLDCWWPVLRALAREWILERRVS